MSVADNKHSTNVQTDTLYSGSQIVSPFLQLSTYWQTTQ